MTDEHERGRWPSVVWRAVALCLVCTLSYGCGQNRSTSSWPLDDRDGDNGFLQADGFPAWSPDGQRIAYWSEDVEKGKLPIRTCISILNLQTGHTDTLLDTYDFAVFSTDWSPDGTLLLLSTPEGIETLSASDGTIRMVVPGEYLASASWSGTSNQIFFINYVGTLRGVYSANPDGSDVRCVTVPADRVYEPWVGADCDSLIAYRSGGGQLCLGAFTPNSVGSFQPIRCGLDAETHSVLSPDHRTIAFLGRAGGNGDIRNLSLLDRATGRVDTLVASGVKWYDFSPDGQRIVYADYEHTGGLDIVNVTTKEVRHLTHSAVD